MGGWVANSAAIPDLSVTPNPVALTYGVFATPGALGATQALRAVDLSFVLGPEVALSSASEWRLGAQSAATSAAALQEVQ